MGTKAKSDIVKMVNNEVELLQILDKSSAVSAFGSHDHGEISTEKIEGVKGVVMKINCKHRLVYLTSIPQKVKPPKPQKQPRARKVKTIKAPKQKTSVYIIDPITDNVVYQSTRYKDAAHFLGTSPQHIRASMYKGYMCKGYIIKKNNDADNQ